MYFLEKNAVFWAIIVLNVLPVWFFPTIVTQDGAAHLYNAQVLAHWFSGENINFYSHFYHINTSLSPNWLSEIFLAILLKIGMNVSDVERCFISIYALLLPLSLKTAWRVIAPEKQFNAYWILPLVFNYTFFYCFYNFCLIIPIAFFTITYGWHIYQKTSGFGVLSTLFFSFLIGITYFSHPVSWLLVFCVSMALPFTRFLKNRKNGNDFNIQILPIIAAFLPTIGLFFGFSQQNGLAFFEWKIGRYPLLKWLIGWQSGCAFEGNEAQLFYILGGLFWVLIAVSVYRHFISQKAILQKNTFFYLLEKNEFPVLLSLPFLLFLYLFAPDSTAGGAYLTVRVSYFLLFFATLFLPRLDKKYLHFAPIFTCILLWGLRAAPLRTAGNIVRTVLWEAKYIAPNSVVLPLIYDKYGREQQLQPRMYLFKHLAAHLGTQKPLILLDNYEAATDYFPLKWQESCNSFTKMGKEHGIDDDIPEVDISAYEKSANCTVDYILTIGTANRSFPTYIRCDTADRKSRYVSLYKKVR